MTTDDLAWVQSRLRNCTNARRQLRICAECLSVAEDTLLERLGYTSLDTFRAAHPQNKQPVGPPVERMSVAGHTGPMWIDCDLQDAYYNNTNLNKYLTAPEFPVLGAGATQVSWSGGIDKCEVVPRWWRL